MFIKTCLKRVAYSLWFLPMFLFAIAHYVLSHTCDGLDAILEKMMEVHDKLAEESHEEDDDDCDV